jgi:hypothetical protein
MMLCNQVSRYDVAIAAIAGGARTNPRVAADAHVLISYFKHRARLDKKYIYENGKGGGCYDCQLHAANKRYRSFQYLRYAYFYLNEERWYSVTVVAM